MSILCSDLLHHLSLRTHTVAFLALAVEVSTTIIQLVPVALLTGQCHSPRGIRTSRGVQARRTSAEDTLHGRHLRELRGEIVCSHALSPLVSQVSLGPWGESLVSGNVCAILPHGWSARRQRVRDVTHTNSRTRTRVSTTHTGPYHKRVRDTQHSSRTCTQCHSSRHTQTRTRHVRVAECDESDTPRTCSPVSNKCVQDQVGFSCFVVPPVTCAS